MQIIQDYSQGDCQESLPPSCKRHGFFLLAVAVADRVLGRKAAPPPSNNHRIYQQQPRSVPQGYILPDIPGPTSSQMYQTQPLPWPRPDFPVETSSAGLNSSGQIMTSHLTICSPPTGRGHDGHTCGQTGAVGGELPALPDPAPVYQNPVQLSVLQHQARLGALASHLGLTIWLPIIPLLLRKMLLRILNSLLL